jgi:YjbE family integral membrane protein
LAAAGLPHVQRNRVILIGILAAAVLRILFALVTVQLLQIIGLLLAGGILLLWVCWKFYRELRVQGALGDEDAEPPPEKTVTQAIVQIIIADVSMSLDNVLAVAGIARDHTVVLIIGLALSVAFMGFAATMIARLLDRHRWIAYFGLLVIFYVAVSMIVDGAIDVYFVSSSGG